MKCVYNHCDWFEHVVKEKIKEMLEEFIEFYRKKGDQVVVGCCIVFDKTPTGCDFTLYYEYDFSRSSKLTTKCVKELVYKKDQERILGSSIFARTMMIDYDEYTIVQWIRELLNMHDKPGCRNYLVFTIRPIAKTDYMDYIVELRPSDTFVSCPCLDDLDNPRNKLSLEVNFEKAFDFSSCSVYLDLQLKESRLKEQS